MQTYLPAPGAGHPTTQRSRGDRRSVEPIDRGRVEIERALVHRSQQRLRRGTTTATSPKFRLRTLDGEPPHKRGVRLVRTRRSTHALEREAKLGVGCYGNARVLAGHRALSVARWSYPTKGRSREVDAVPQTPGRCDPLDDRLSSRLAIVFAGPLRRGRELPSRRSSSGLGGRRRTSARSACRPRRPARSATAGAGDAGTPRGVDLALS